MTQSGSTASQEEPVEVGLKDFLARIYRLFYNKFFGLVLIMVMAALTMMGTLIEQAPAGTMADPASKEQFLASARQTYGGWVSVFSALGVFNMFSSPLRNDYLCRSRRGAQVRERRVCSAPLSRTQ